MAQEIRKPTANTVDVGITLNNPLQAYDTATGGDETTNADWYNPTDSTHRFHTWQTTVETYTALSLYIKWSGTTGFADDIWGIEYSLNGGGSWGLWLLPMGANGNVVIQTESVGLATDQILSDIEVRIVYDRTGGGDKEDTYIWDIWTDGTYTAGLPDRNINIDYELGYTTEDIISFLPFYSINTYDEGFTTEEVTTLIPEYFIDSFDDGFTIEDITIDRIDGSLPDRNINIETEYGFTIEDVIALIPEYHVDIYDEGFTTEDIIFDILANINLYDEGFTTEDVTTFIPEYYVDVYDEGFTIEDITLFLPFYSINIFDVGFTTEDVILLIPIYNIDIYSDGFTTEDITISVSEVLADLDINLEIGYAYTTEDIIMGTDALKIEAKE